MGNMNIKTKLLILFVVIGILPLAIIGVFSYQLAQNSLIEAEYHTLSAINALKKKQLEDYFHKVEIDIKTVAESDDVTRAYDAFKAYHDKMGFSPSDPYDVTTPEYSSIWNHHNTLLEKYAKNYRYYDIFIICAAHGHVMYTNARESDIGTNLASGQYRNTHLATLWKKVKSTQNIVMEDFQPYAPSNGDPAAFLGIPIIREGTMTGVYAVQVPLEPISNIMDQRKGMGKSGESYLVGSDHLMRSDSYLDKENYSVLASFKNKNKVLTEGVKLALQGKSGTKIINDYRGQAVLSSFDQVNILGNIKWAILSEIDESESLSSVYLLRNSLLALLVIITALVSFSGWYFGRGIANPLIIMSDILNEISNQVASASRQLSSAAQNLSESSSESASSLEETSSSIEEFSSMIQTNSGNAQEVNALAQQSRQAAEKGDTEIQSLIVAMSEIVEASKKIEEIINVIDSIAFQTNLLSLNAAVEAARAGEHGKGFAVVAEAVRNLAQQSASAAKDISSIIKESVDKSNRGSKIATKSGESLKEILTSSKKVADLISEIASACQEQTQAITQISQAITQIDQATQNNAGTSEEAAATSEELAAQGEKLSGTVQELVELVTGKSHDLKDQRNKRNMDEPNQNIAKFSSELPAPHNFGAPKTHSQKSKEIIPFDDDDNSEELKIDKASGF